MHPFHTVHAFAGVDYLMHVYAISCKQQKLNRRGRKGYTQGMNKTCTHSHTQQIKKNKSTHYRSKDLEPAGESPSKLKLVF